MIVRGAQPTSALGRYTEEPTARALYHLTLAQRTGTTQGTVLTIRVARSDCAAVAAGRMTAADFRRCAVVHQY